MPASFQLPTGFDSVEDTSAPKLSVGVTVLSIASLKRTTKVCLPAPRSASVSSGSLAVTVWTVGVAVSMTISSATDSARLPPRSVSVATICRGPSANAGSAMMTSPAARSAAVSTYSTGSSPSIDRTSVSPATAAAPSTERVSSFTRALGVASLVRRSVAEAPRSEAGSSAVSGAAGATVSSTLLCALLIASRLSAVAICCMAATIWA